MVIANMDAHSGNPPDPNEKVYVDHILSVGAHDPSKVTNRHRVNYKNKIPVEVAELLPSFVHGTQVQEWAKNGDMYFVADQLKNGEKKSHFPRIHRNGEPHDYGYDMYGWWV